MLCIVSMEIDIRELTLENRIVSTILSLATPTIRRLILSNLPNELGMWLKSLPSTFSVRGEFEFSGIEIEQLTQPFAESALFQDLCFYNDVSNDPLYLNISYMEDLTSLCTDSTGHVCGFSEEFRTVKGV